MKVEAGIFEYYRLAKEKGINNLRAKKLLRYNYGCMERLLTKSPSYLIQSIKKLSKKNEKLTFNNISDNVLEEKLKNQFKFPKYLGMDSWLMPL